MRNTKEDRETVVRTMLAMIGEDPNREGLLETPKRVLKSWQEIYGGYTMKASEILKTFDEPHDEMVVLRDIEFYSNCEHHMQPFHGQAHVGYLPNQRVVGISKLARLVDAFSRRLQIQERIGTQVADAVMHHLKPLGCAVVLEARHFCIACRGVGKQNSIMGTSAMRGVFKEDHKVRDEFLRMIGK